MKNKKAGIAIIILAVLGILTVLYLLYRKGLIKQILDDLDGHSANKGLDFDRNSAEVSLKGLKTHELGKIKKWVRAFVSDDISELRKLKTESMQKALDNLKANTQSDVHKILFGDSSYCGCSSYQNYHGHFDSESSYSKDKMQANVMALNNMPVFPTMRASRQKSISGVQPSAERLIVICEDGDGNEYGVPVGDGGCPQHIFNQSNGAGCCMDNDRALDVINE